MLRVGARLANEHSVIEVVEFSLEPYVRAINRASRLLLQKNCLVRAVALRLMLSRRSVNSRLHLGVRKALSADSTYSSAVVAHAWLSVDGRTLVGGENATAFYRELPLPQAQTLEVN